VTRYIFESGEIHVSGLCSCQNLLKKIKAQQTLKVVANTEYIVGSLAPILRDGNQLIRRLASLMATSLED
jgi:hypothetical protein